jgi:TP901 family phage tail tape measure protein
VAADVSKQIKIAIDVIGNAAGQFTKIADGLTKLATPLAAISKNAQTVANGVTALGNALQPLKEFSAPGIGTFVKDVQKLARIDNTKINEFSASMKQLSSIRVPSNFQQFAEGLRALGSVRKIPDLTNVAASLKQLSGISIPAGKITNLASSLMVFNATSIPSGKKISEFAVGLQSLSSVKGIPTSTIANLAEAFAKWNNVRFPTAKKLRDFASGLASLAGKKLPSATNLGKLAESLRAFTSLGRMPSLRAFITSIQQLAKVDTTHISRLASQLRNLSSSMSTLASLGNAGQGLTRTVDSARAASNSLTQFGQSAQQAGGFYGQFIAKLERYSIYRVIADAVFGLQQAFDAARESIISYDQALKDLQAITNATDMEVARMGTTIKEVAATTKFSAAEIAEGMRTLGQAGFGANESIQTMQAVSDLATGTLSTMSSTVDLVSTAMRVFDVEAASSAHVADVFANAVNRSKLTIDKLRISMNYVGPIAKQAGVSFEEMAAAMGTLANNGIRASTIGTGLRRIFAELLDPSRGFQDAINRSGVVIEQLDPRLNSLQEVLGNLRLVLTDSSVAFEAFGKRGAAAALALVDSQQGFAQMLENVNEYGSAARMASTQMEGLGVMIKNLKDRLGVLAVALGEAGIIDFMKALIVVAREVVIALTYLANSGIGHVFVKVGLLMGSTTLLIGLFKGLLSILTLTRAASVAAATGIARVTGATAAAAAAGAALNPILAGIQLAMLAIAVAGVGVVEWLNKFKNAASEASEAAAELGNQQDSLAEYYKSIVGLAEGSSELENINKGLKKSLIDIGKGTDSVAIAARAAAATIDSYTGEILDNGKAISAYQKIVNDVKFEKLQEASNAAVRNIERVTSAQNQLINRSIQWSSRVGDAVGANLAALFQAASGDFQKASEEYSKYLDTVTTKFEAEMRASRFSDRLNEGLVSFEEFAKYANEIEIRGPFTKMEEDIAKSFRILEETTTNFVRELEATNQIDMSMTTDQIREVVDGLVDTELQAQGVVFYLDKVRASLANIPKTGLEALVEELKGSKQSVADFVSEFQKITNGALTGDQRVAIELISAQRKALAEKVKAEQESYAAAKATSEDLETLAKNHYAQMKVYEKELLKLNEAGFNEYAYYQVQRVREAKKAHQQAYESAEQLYENNANLLGKAKTEADLAYQEAIAKALISPYDAAKLEQDLKEGTAILNTQLATRLHNITVANIKDKESKEKIEAEKFAATLYYKQKELEATLAVQRQLEAQNDDSESFKRIKAISERLQQEILDLKRTQYEESAEEAIKAADKIIEVEEKITKESTKNSDKIKDAVEDRNKDILDAEVDLQKKIKEINEDLNGSLEKLNKERLENEQETRQNVASLEDRLQKDILEIQNRGLSPKQQDKQNRQQSYRDLLEGEKLIAEASRENDLAKLERGKELLEQSYDLAKNFDSEKKAINGIKAATEALKKAEEIEGKLKDLEIQRQKEEEIEQAVAKRRAEEQAANKEKAKAIEVYEGIISKEKERHASAMQSLEAELSKWKEQLAVAEKLAELASSSDISSALSDDKSTSQKQTGVESGVSDALDLESEKLNALNAQMADVAKAYEKMFADAHTSVAGGFDTVGQKAAEASLQAAKEVSDIVKNGYMAVEENGTVVYKNVTEGIRNQFKQMVDEIIVDGEPVQKMLAEANVDTSGLDAAKIKTEAVIALVGDGIEFNIAESSTAPKAIDDLSKDIKALQGQNTDVEVAIVAKDGQETVEELDTIKGKVNEVTEGDKEVKIGVSAEELQKMLDTAETMGLFEKDKSFRLEVQVSGDDRMVAMAAMMPQFVDRIFKITANVDAAIAACRNLLSVIQDIVKYDGKTVKINVIESVTRVEERAEGGVAGYAGGGSVFKRLYNRFIASGSGFKDDVPAMLMKGEFVHRTAAVKKYGRRFMEMINNLSFPKEVISRIVPNFATGGPVSLDVIPNFIGSAVQNFATGGSVSPIISKLLLSLTRSARKDVEPVSLVNVNNIIQTASKGITSDLGASALAKITESANNAIASFETGGDVFSILKEIQNTRSGVASIYRDQISAFQRSGEGKIARLLQQEQLALFKVIQDLEEELRKLKLEHDEYVKTRTEEYKLAKKERKDEYDRDVADEKQSYDEDTYDNLVDFQRTTDEYNRDVTENKQDRKNREAEYKADVDALEAEHTVAAYQEQLTKFRDALRENMTNINSIGYANFYNAFTGRGYRPTGYEQPDLFTILLKKQTLSRELEAAIDESLSGIFDSIHKNVSELSEFADILPEFEYDRSNAFDQERALEIYKSFNKADLTTLSDTLRDAIVKSGKKDLKAAYDLDISDLDISLQGTKRDYSQYTDDYNLEKQRRDDAHAVSLADLKSVFDKDNLTEKTAFDEDIAANVVKYEENVADAKQNAEDEKTEIKDKTLADIQSVRDKLQQNLDGVVANYQAGVENPQEAASIKSDTKYYLDLYKKLFATYLKTSIGGYNLGGIVQGMGSVVKSMFNGAPGKDSVLAKLTPGEGVIREPVMRLLGEGWLKALNSFRAPAFNLGGVVDSNSLTNSSVASTNSTIHKLELTLNGKTQESLIGSRVGIESIITELELAKARTGR